MTSRVQEKLPELFELAYDRSEGARLQLAGKLAELFLVKDNSLTAREEELVNELIDLLLKSDSPVMRQELVRKFADATKMPRAMAVNLVREKIEIARPILLTNEALTDDDLVTIVATESRDHSCAIAARRVVNEAVTDALIVTGDLKIMQIVAENLGAKLTPRSMEILAEGARVTTSLQKPMIQRPELSQELATKIYWWVSQDLRRAVVQRFGISASHMDMSLAKVIDEKLGGHLLEKHDDAVMLSVADWLEDRGMLRNEILTKLLRLGHFRLFNIVLGKLVDIGLPLVDTIVESSGGRTMAVLCRALSIDKGGFISIFLLSRGARVNDQIVHPRELSYALAAYDKLNEKTAKSLLLSWKTSPETLLRLSEEQVNA